ncbi:MAG: bifunctional adenosylcobinamide kinase/adenosylcobinamide-phosphate guanylyltransferase [Rhodospirillales bacterium]|nr:bifunctional adenosylcobinamide kinase/adenosylcobinamide-phosphate guanylyltransferase [Rhodospirillales bacterium]
MSNDVTLIIGGARSGKSRFAESYALGKGLKPIYVATSEIRDDEMRKRIQLHRESRDACWTTIEEPLRLAELIAREASSERVLLIDCLTLWLSNHLERKSDISAEIKSLQAALNNTAGPVVLVSNEVGQGIVPLNKLARTFRDEAGRMNQAVAATAQNVYAVVAGLTLPLKTNNVPTGPEIS